MGVNKLNLSANKLIEEIYKRLVAECKGEELLFKPVISLIGDDLMIGEYYTTYTKFYGIETPERKNILSLGQAGGGPGSEHYGADIAMFDTNISFSECKIDELLKNNIDYKQSLLVSKRNGLLFVNKNHQTKIYNSLKRTFMSVPIGEYATISDEIMFNVYIFSFCEQYGSGFKVEYTNKTIEIIANTLLNCINK